MHKSDVVGGLILQGKQSLVTHFQNSSLLHEDKRCRPILFESNGETAGEQEPFPVSGWCASILYACCSLLQLL